MKVWLFPFLFVLFQNFKVAEKKEERHLCHTCTRNGCSHRNYNYPPSKMIKCSMYKE